MKKTIKRADPFYKSKQWRDLRARVLKRDGYKCQVSLRDGVRRPADTVHHIFPAEDYPQYRLKSWNLISVSRDVHGMLHDRTTHELTEAGKSLLIETAERMNIKNPYESETILVIGMPGTGKTTYARQRLGQAGVCYDMDYIAAALQLQTPGEDKYKSIGNPARRIANSLFAQFAQMAHRYARRVIVIRTAPTIDEIENVDPTEIVICRGGYGNVELQDDRRHALASRIAEAERIAKARGIPVKEVTRELLTTTKQ